MGWQGTALNAGANGIAALATHASLHSADPGATGASELAGGTPAYARKAVAWDAAAGGARQLSADQTFDIPAGGTVAYVGYWTALTGGTWLGGFAVTSEGPYGAQGQYKLLAAQTSLAVANPA